jgi:small-conductance mechanosensitive channel
MFSFPSYKQGDIISTGGLCGIYQCLGFLRTSLTCSDGAIAKVPNSILLSGLLSIQD